jgi:hypothetical protein
MFGLGLPELIVIAVVLFFVALVPASILMAVLLMRRKRS